MMKSLKPTAWRTTSVLIAAASVLSLSVLSFITLRYCSPSFANPQAQLGQAAPKESSQIATSESVETAAPPGEDGDRKNASASTEITAVEAAINWTNPICSETSKRSIVCEVEGDIRIRGNSQTIFVPSSLIDREWKAKPYCRKQDRPAMKNVTAWTFTPFSAAAPPPRCTVKSAVPALVFSVGGFTNNLFHSFTDVLIPLFISSYDFHGEIQFVMADIKPWWMDLFISILKRLTNYRIIDAGDEEERRAVRCFPRAIVGLRFHKELGINASRIPVGHSMAEFKALLRRTYGLKRATVEWAQAAKPRLLIISRKETRVILNEGEMAEMAVGLGFEVSAAEANRTTDLGDFARLVNSADVMIGVHGAGLTNMVFLPAGAVLIQVVPITGLDWLPKSTFGKPSSAMGIKYLEYAISEEESTLSEQYPRDHPVLRDPYSIHKLGWTEISKTYLENQDVRLDLGRLRNTLLEALKFLPHPNHA